MWFLLLGWWKVVLVINIVEIFVILLGIVYVIDSGFLK